MTRRTERIACRSGLSSLLTLSAGSTTTICQSTPGTEAVVTNDDFPVRRSGASPKTGLPEMAAATLGSALRSFSDSPRGSFA